MRRNIIDSAIAKLELIDIYLNDSALYREVDFVRRPELSELKQQQKQTISADVLVEENEGEESARIALRVLVSFGVRFVADENDVGQAETVLAEIEASFCALYKCSEMLSDDEVKEFVKHNAVHNVWPFWREHAYLASAKANLPKPVIPLMKPRPHVKP